jgi:hypothetical protein
MKDPIPKPGRAAARQPAGDALRHPAPAEFHGPHHRTQRPRKYQQ